MAAYFVVNVDVHDMAGMREYIDRVPAIVEKYGGRYLVRGGNSHVLEGKWRPKLVALLEFPNLDQARRWYDCKEYAEFKAARLKAAESDMVLVEGV